MEELVELAKLHGVVLTVSVEHQQSEASRAMIMIFLTGIIALYKTNPTDNAARDVDNQLATDDLTTRSEHNPSLINEASFKDQDERLHDLQKENDLLREQISDVQAVNTVLINEDALSHHNLDKSRPNDEWLYRPWCLECDERFIPEYNDEPSCPYHSGQSVIS